MTIRFWSVCSGIEDESVAFGPLGWQAAWLSEIEPFPCVRWIGERIKKAIEGENND